MNARLRMKLYRAGITSPDMLWHAIDSATAKAYPAPRITRSRRVRQWRVITLRAGLLLAAVITLYACR
ncbi:hypothetical protein MASR1M8_16150 [Thermomonas brevis]